MNFSKKVNNLEMEKLARKIAIDLVKTHKSGAQEAQWPFTANEIGFYCAKDFLGDLLDIVKNENFSDFVPPLNNPSKYTLYFNLFPAIRHTMKKENKKLLSKTIYGIVKEAREEPLCSGGDNRIRSPDFVPGRFKQRDEHYFRITGLLNMYNELKHPVFLAFGREMHGPYKEDNKYYYIKDYFDLASPILFSKGFKWKEISIIEEHDKKALKFDFFDHLVSLAAPEKYKVIADGKEIMNTKAFSEDFLYEANKIVDKTTGMEKKDWLNMGVEAIYWSAKDLFDHTHKSWKPKKRKFKGFPGNPKIPDDEITAIERFTSTFEHSFGLT